MIVVGLVVIVMILNEIKSRAEGFNLHYGVAYHELCHEKILLENTESL